MTDDRRQEALALMIHQVALTDPSYELSSKEDADYNARNRCVMASLTLANSCGFKTGIQRDKSEDGWLIVFIELPTGQVSWHIPEFEGEWDGHTTGQKYDRVHSYTATVWAGDA
jgi:hypothetical protein